MQGGRLGHGKAVLAGRQEPGDAVGGAEVDRGQGNTRHQSEQHLMKGSAYLRFVVLYN